MTTVIKVYHKSKKMNKKPGWQKIEAEHNEWLKRMNAISLFGSKPKAAGRTIDPVVRTAFIDEKRLSTGKSLMTPGDTSTKPVYRPEHQYKNNPEMLQRELLAKERKFNIAPTYNKGAEQMITDEMMKDVKAGLNRRRS